MQPDFLLWNGDQSNDVHFEKDMAWQFLAPAGLAIADRWPLAYVRGNHDVRGPAALVLDTGEDKPDDSPYLTGLGAFQKMQRAQAEWLKGVVKEKWFREAPHKVLFCHIPLWFNHPKIPNNKFDGSKYCRELWVPTLDEAGVKLVISGHTHDFLWMPAKESQPIAQLIGGAPQPKNATFIQGTATRDALTLKMSKLDGTVVADVTLNA